MSASNEIFQYHLTPSGWAKGSDKIDFSGWQERPIPENRLLTVGFREYISSGYSDLDCSAEIETFGSDEAIKVALEKYGTDPRPSSRPYVGWREFVDRITA